MSPRILFLTRGGRMPEWSTGHLSRCDVTAKAVRKMSPAAQFAFLFPEDPLAKQFVSKRNYKFWTFSSAAKERKATQTVIKRWKPDILVLDKLTVNPALVKWLGRFGKVIVSLDDAGKGIHYSDLSLNPLIPNPDTQYNSYHCLTLADHRIKTKSCRPRAKSCLIALGGNADRGMTLKILKALKPFSWAQKLRLDVYAGLENSRTPELQSIVKSFAPGSRVHTFQKMDDFLKTVAASDAAIVAGGLTMFEVSRLGVPAGSVTLRDHQKNNIEKMSGMNLVLNLGSRADSSMVQKIKRLLEDAKLRRSLSAASCRYWKKFTNLKAVQLIQIVTAHPKKRFEATVWPKILTPAILDYAVRFFREHKIQKVHLAH